MTVFVPSPAPAPSSAAPAHFPGAAANAARIVPIDSVRAPDRRLRALLDVDALRDSIATVGLLQPLVVDESLTLLCGMHRLEACRQLGWTEVPVNVIAAHGARARLAEIDENLCRRELSALERAEHLAMRKQLWEEIHASDPEPPAEETPAGKKAGKKKKKAANKSEPALEAFLADTERKTGRARSLIKQELKIGALSEPVRELARETPVSRSKKDLLALTRMDEDEQRAAIEAVRSGEARSVRRRTPRAAVEAVTDGEDLPLDDDAAPADDGAGRKRRTRASASNPWQQRWTDVAVALERGERELDLALGSWPEDPAHASDTDGDAGREALREAIESVRVILTTVRGRLDAA